jgi:hypothetical protein
MEKLQSMIAGTAPSEQIALGSAVELVRLINSKAVDMATSLPTMAGGQITFGEILASRTEGVTRRNGTVGTDYVRVHELSQDTAKQWIPELKKFSAKPNNSSFAGKGKKANSAKAEETFTKDEVLQLVAELIKNNGASAPTVAEGHETVEEIAEAVAIEINVGDVVSINGQLRQVVEGANGAFRLNKTIV